VHISGIISFATQPIGLLKLFNFPAQPGMRTALLVQSSSTSTYLQMTCILLLRVLVCYCLCACLCLNCLCAGGAGTMLLLIPTFAVASAHWKQASLNWSFNTIGRMVSIRSWLHFPIICWLKIKHIRSNIYYSHSKRNYIKSATWLMDVEIIVSSANPHLFTVSGADNVSFLSKLFTIVRT